MKREGDCLYYLRLRVYVYARVCYGGGGEGLNAQENFSHLSYKKQTPMKFRY
jgi:hypothetical protein